MGTLLRIISGILFAATAVLIMLGAIALWYLAFEDFLWCVLAALMTAFGGGITAWAATVLGMMKQIAAQLCAENRPSDHGLDDAADELNAEDVTDDGDVDDEELIVLLGSTAGT